MSLASFNNCSEHLCWHDLDFIEYHETPFSVFDHLKDFFRLCRPFSLSGNHCISWNQDQSFILLTFCLNGNLVFGIGAQFNYFAANMGKSKKLLFPLLYRYQVLAQYNATLFYSACCKNACESLSSTARQHDHTRASPAIWKHLT